ncbi:hypothetical protein DPQ22_09820, partial [Candidatus Tokpelaia sp.]
KLDDATKMVGCYRALAKIGLKEEGAPMQSAIAFAQVIDHSADKVSSKDFAKNFPKITQAFQQAEHEAGSKAPFFTILAEHVDGSMSGNERENKLNFLKGFSSSVSTRAIETKTACANPVTTHDYPQKEETRSVCRVLSNVRCLSERVDVPALDAVLFLSGKNSQIEITQAVGRVMRTAPGKKLGYVILPVVIPAGQTEEEFLKDSKTWQTTWQVVQALRSHDAGIDNSIARAVAGDFSGKIEIIDIRNLQTQTKTEGSGLKHNPQRKRTIGGKDNPPGEQGNFEFHVNELMRGIYAKLAEKCGTRLYWPQWAERLGRTAETLKLRIGNILESSNLDYKAAQKAFGTLEQALKDNISIAIDKEETLNILAAQAIAMPVFSCLFGVEEHDFPAHNIVAKSLQTALDEILKFMQEEREQLAALYSDIRAQLGDNPSDAFRQSLIKDIYQNTI